MPENRRRSSQSSQPAKSPITPPDAGSSFAARFGRVILSHGIAVVPTALYHFQGKLDLSAQLVWFISNILSHKWDADLPYPSLNKMARCGGVDKTQLYDYKERLCKQGLLRVYQRRDSTGKRDTNAYDLAPLFGKLEALIASEGPEPNQIRGEGASPEQFAVELSDSSFVARYGRVITGYGITAVPRAIFTHGAALGLSLQQAWFVTYIFSYKWDTPLPYPSIKRMSARTGYSTVQLHNIKGELARAGQLRLVPRYTAEGGQDSNAYDFSGLLDAITRLLEEPPPASPAEGAEGDDAPAAPHDERSPRRGRKPAAASAYQANETDSGAQLPGVGGAHLAGVSGGRLLGVSGGRLPGAGGGELSGVSGDQLSSHTNVTPPSSVVRSSQRMVVRTFHEIEALKEESINRDDSNQTSLTKKGGYAGKKRAAAIPLPVPIPNKSAARPAYSPYIAEVITDFSNELGDSAHAISNVTQALRLWQDAGIEERAFVDLLYRAKARTRRSQARPHWDLLENKMSYFFVTLRNMISEISPE